MLGRILISFLNYKLIIKTKIMVKKLASIELPFLTHGSESVTQSKFWEDQWGCEDDLLTWMSQRFSFLILVTLSSLVTQPRNLGVPLDYSLPYPS